MSDLKPCPFCGGFAERRKHDHRHPDEPYGLIVDHESGCFLGLHGNSDECFDRWNARPEFPDTTADARARFRLAAATIERDVLLHDLTDEEIDRLIANAIAASLGL